MKEVAPNDCSVDGKPEQAEVCCSATTQTDQNQNQEGHVIKIICAGDYCCNWERHVFLKDYLQTKPVIKLKKYKPLIGANLHTKRLTWRNKLNATKRNIVVQIWELAKIYRFTGNLEVLCKGADGAIKFLGPKNPLSLQGAIEWKNEILKAIHIRTIPVVLLTDNVSPNVNWTGPLGMLKSRSAMGEFSQKNGFVAWFEMVSRDWKSDEKSVFGRAVHTLLEEILNFKDSKHLNASS